MSEGLHAKRDGERAAAVWLAALIGGGFIAFAYARGDAPTSMWGFIKDYLEPLATLAAFIAAAIGGVLLWRQVRS
jgi:hypothetical protein